MINQKEISLPSYRGFHVITNEITKHLPNTTGVVNVLLNTHQQVSQ